MSYLLFAGSLALAILTTRRVTLRLPRREGTNFWLTVILPLLSFGVTVQITSLVSLLRPWIVLLVQAGILAAVWGRRTAGSQDQIHTRKPVIEDSGLLFWALALLVGLFVFLNLIFVYGTPILSGDEVNYSASRPLYWVENGSILPQLTHNYRQYLIHAGTEYLFLWPILFTRDETLGRVFFWLGVPLLLTSVYLLARKLGANRVLALAASALLAFAPHFLWGSVTRKPEIWVGFFLCGACWFLADALQDKDWRFSALGVAAVFLGLAASARVVYSPLLAFPLILALRTKWSAFPRHMMTIVGGFLVATLAFGYFYPFAFAVRHFGHPLGPERVRTELGHTWDWRTVRIYVVRTGMALVETPELRMPRVRLALEKASRSFMTSLHADGALEGEDSGTTWPGRYSFVLTEKPERYALGGLVGVVGLLLVAGSYVIRATRQRSWQLTPLEVAGAFAAAALLGATLPTRWQADSTMPLRLMVSPLAVMLAVFAAWAMRAFGSRSIFAWVLVLLTFYNSVPVLRLSLAVAENRWVSPPPSAAMLDGPYHAALQHIPSSARILFVGSANAADYQLFGARSGYGREVLTWGPYPFDEGRMKAVLTHGKPTHVLIEHRNSVDVWVAPNIDTVKMAAWLAAQPDWEEVSLPETPARLFERRAMATQTTPDTLFNARITASPSTLTAASGAKVPILARVRNESGHIWPGQSASATKYKFRLGNHWLTAAGQMKQMNDGRTDLVEDLRPAGEVDLSLTATAPTEPGDYILELDMVQEHVAWFKDKGSPTWRVPVRVMPAP